MYKRQLHVPRLPPFIVRVACDKEFSDNPAEQTMSSDTVGAQVQGFRFRVWRCQGRHKDVEPRSSWKRQLEVVGAARLALTRLKYDTRPLSSSLSNEGDLNRPVAVRHVLR